MKKIITVMSFILIFLSTNAQHSKNQVFHVGAEVSLVVQQPEPSFSFLVHTSPFIFSKPRIGVWAAFTTEGDRRTGIVGGLMDLGTKTALGLGVGWTDIHTPKEDWEKSYLSGSFLIKTGGLLIYRSNLLILCDIAPYSSHYSGHWYNMIRIPIHKWGVQYRTQLGLGLWNESSLVGPMATLTIPRLGAVSVGPGYNISHKNLGVTAVVSFE